MKDLKIELVMELLKLLEKNRHLFTVEEIILINKVIDELYLKEKQVDIMNSLPFLTSVVQIILQLLK